MTTTSGGLASDALTRALLELAAKRSRLHCSDPRVAPSLAIRARSRASRRRHAVRPLLGDRRMPRQSRTTQRSFGLFGVRWT
jgi:hypothetical protein